MSPKEMSEMENMKAVRIYNYGGPEVLRFEDAPRPTPGSGELLIRVHAAAVNPVDWKVRAGYLKDRIPYPLPFIPGWDVFGRRRSDRPRCDEIQKRGCGLRPAGHRP
jgi:D-arabinose 1-dehydrogenase-like Zn-dependent alcohol dehydrogenase